MQWIFIAQYSKAQWTGWFSQTTTTVYVRRVNCRRQADSARRVPAGEGSKRHGARRTRGEAAGVAAAACRLRLRNGEEARHWHGQVHPKCIASSIMKSFMTVFAARCYHQARPLPSCGVCVCVCVRLSVTFVNCVKTNKHIFKIFPPSGSQVILVFQHHTGWQYSDGNTHTVVECR